MCPCHSGGIREHKLRVGVGDRLKDRHGAICTCDLGSAEEYEGRSRAPRADNKLGSWAQSINLKFKQRFVLESCASFFHYDHFGRRLFHAAPRQATAMMEYAHWAERTRLPRRPTLIGRAPFCSLLQKSGCASDNGGIDGKACTVYGLPFSQVLYSRLWRVGPCGINTGLHMLFSRYLSTSTQQYKDSSIVPTR